MNCRACTGRCAREFAWISTGVGNILLNVLNRQGRVDHEHVRDRSKQRDCREIFFNIVVQFFIEAFVDGICRRANIKPCAVCGATGNVLCANIAVGTSLVLNDYRLTSLKRQLSGNDASNDICGATRRVSDNKRERWLCGIGLCL